MANFTKIGTGIDKKTKTGKPCIKLTLDKDAQQKLANHDFENGIWIFKCKNNNGKEYYSVNAPMPDDYQINYENMAKNWQKKFENKHKEQTEDEFRDWTEK
ncbi:MAG: hypothetical protein VKL60_13545 [Sphaerospermopsis sp.]|nr:hypothetical protein [Sphaerospermopsis sp.]